MMRYLLFIILVLMMPFSAFAQDESEDSLEIEWNTRGYDLEGETDTTFDVTCPAQGSTTSLWGTEIYTDDSSVCSAAAHMGLITVEDGGSFVVTILDGEESYEGTEQNAVSSSDWDDWGRSFSVSSETRHIEWGTRGNELEGETDTTIHVTCPVEGVVGSLWGTEIYTDDSSICTTAVHMGLISVEEGGAFVVTILDGQEAYTGSTQNEIESSEWGDWSRSFSVSPDVLEIEWNTRGNELEGETDDTINVTCPAEGVTSSLWGTEIYTDDSSVCTVAVHMGLITVEDGGSFVVTILDGEEAYTGSEINSIESSEWGDWSRSFSVSELSSSSSSDDL